jgi:RHS repeat-associated protein
LATTPTRTKYYDVAYGPYGESYAGSGTTDLDFTGQNPDVVSGMYDFLFREYHPTQGRWISPDPAGRRAVNPGNPQSWNRYAYVLGNPLSMIDPYGLDPCPDGSQSPPGVPCVTVVDGGGGGGDDGGGSDGGGGYGSYPVPQPQIYPGGKLNDGSRGGGAPVNNGPTISAGPPLPWYKNPCITSALGDAALHVGIDAIGLIPEAGGLARVIGHQAGYVGVVADQLGTKVIQGVGGSAGTVQGLAGLGDTSPEGLASTGLTVAGFIPGLGQAAAVGSIGVDVYKTVKAIGQCH